MLLTIDIGNTNITYGCFYSDSDKVAHYANFKTDKLVTTDDLAIAIFNLLSLWKMNASYIDSVIVSSVVPQLNYPFAHLFKKYFNLSARFIDQSSVPIKIDYEYPNEIGADRLVNTYAGLRLYPDNNLIIVDFGTATTFDIVAKEGIYLGGIIAPGIMTSLRSLEEKAAKLPHIDLTNTPSLIGKNTVDGIRSGILYGNGAMVDELTRRIAIEMEWENYLVIFTGGLSELIAQTSRTNRKIDKFLTLKGLFYLGILENG